MKLTPCFAKVSAVALAVLMYFNAPAQSTAVQTSNHPTNAPMKTFVVIFRQGPHTLSDADKLRRAEETSAWARRVNAAGHKLDPRILEPENAHRGPEAAATRSASEHPVTALLFLEAADLKDATQIAEAHPALHYGSVVEIRPWTAPTPQRGPAANPPK